MAFADGWVCRACWKPNRQRDERCYVCKVPRGADASFVEAERKARELANKQPRPEQVPDWLVALPAVVFAWMGWLYRKGAIVVVFFSLLLIFVSPLLTLVGFGVAIAYYVNGVVYRAISNGMRNRAIWAFFVGLLLTGLPAASFIYVQIAFPVPPGQIPASAEATVNLVMAVSWVNALVCGLAAACALVGLVLFFTRPAPRGVAAPQPQPQP